MRFCSPTNLKLIGRYVVLLWEFDLVEEIIDALDPFVNFGFSPPPQSCSISERDQVWAWRMHITWNRGRI